MVRVEAQNCAGDGAGEEIARIGTDMKSIPFQVSFSDKCGSELKSPLGSEPSSLGVVRKNIASSIDDWRGFQPDDVLGGDVVKDVIENFSL